VEVAVCVGTVVAVLVGVDDGRPVGVCVGVIVDVRDGVEVRVDVGVSVGIAVGLGVGVRVGVHVGINVGVMVGVFDGVIVVGERAATMDTIGAIDMFKGNPDIVWVGGAFSQGVLQTWAFLLQALPDKERMELIIQKATELGVYSIVPFKSKRSISLEERT